MNFASGYSEKTERVGLLDHVCQCWQWHFQERYSYVCCVGIRTHWRSSHYLWHSFKTCHEYVPWWWKIWRSSNSSIHHIFLQYMDGSTWICRRKIQTAVLECSRIVSSLHFWPIFFFDWPPKHFISDFVENKVDLIGQTSGRQWLLDCIKLSYFLNSFPGLCSCWQRPIIIRRVGTAVLGTKLPSIRTTSTSASMHLQMRGKESTSNLPMRIPGKNFMAPNPRNWKNCWPSNTTANNGARKIRSRIWRHLRTPWTCPILTTIENQSQLLLQSLPIRMIFRKPIF